MSTLKHHGLSETIEKMGKKSDGIIFQKYIWQLIDEIVLPVTSKTFVIKDHNLKNEDMSFRFFTQTKNGSITMWGMDGDEELKEYFESIKYFEGLDKPENVIGIPVE